MFIKLHVCRKVLLAYEVDKHIIPVDFIESTKNALLIESCSKLNSCEDIEEESSIYKYARYKDKSRDEINKDLAFLSLALFDKSNIVSITNTTMTVLTRKFLLDESGVVQVVEDKHTLDKPLGVFSDSDLTFLSAKVQGKYIIFDVLDKLNGAEFEYNLLLDLKTSTFQAVNIIYHINKPVMLLNNGKSIDLINSNTFKVLHKIVSASLCEDLEFALDSELGLLFVLRKPISESKFRINFVLGAEEDVLILSKVFSEEDYVDFISDLLNTGVLKLDSGQSVICTRQYSCKDFLLNNVRRNEFTKSLNTFN